ncbi:hypothetical protein [Paramagnetospirillum marisnigri]|uniref:hypothetical protein n=1 Tax=Paramagnetospirillum marisnigri TaxID=1285242 RepID=UPI0012E86E9B|nr:hypothetical protein [Paramagnetospirillum marisnigri]
MMRRFLSDGRPLDEFFHSQLVACPQCGKRAELVYRNGEVRLACVMCGYCRSMGGVSNPEGDPDIANGIPGVDFPASRISWSLAAWKPVDLWLRTPCCGDVLWAYNLEHLLYLKEFIAASLRERRPIRRDPKGPVIWRNKAMISRMPRWMKDRRNRDAILAAIAKLERMARS